MLPRRVLAIVVLIITAGSMMSSLAYATPHHAAITNKNGTSEAKVEFDGFSVAVTLSDKAKEKLTRGKETIIVAAYFTGRPKPDTDRKYISHIGEIGDQWQACNL